MDDHATVDEAKEKEPLWLRLTAYVVMALAVPGFLMVMDGVGSIFRGVKNWLKFGAWDGETFWSGIVRYFPEARRPFTDWVMPDRLINWVLDGPRWFWMPVAAVLYYVAWFAALMFVFTTGERIMKRVRG